MTKKSIILPLVGLFLYVTLSSYWYGPAYGGSINGTGATGGTTCGGGCHGSVASSSTTVTIQLLSGTTPVTSYIPGNAYTLKISGVNTSSSTLPYYGFQACIVKASGAGTGSALNAGTFGTAPGGTHVQSGTVSVFEHYNAGFGDGSIIATTGTGGTGTTYVQSIPWTAPSAGTGSVVLYGVINAINHNSSADAGDFWNNATPVTICEAPAPITGTLSVCAGSTTALSVATSGGTWSSVSPSIGTVSSSGVVTGIGAGTTSISYTTSCGSVGAVVTVNPLPSLITGIPTVCAGSTTTLFDGTAGGTWTSGSPAIASITGAGTTATVTGVSTSGGTTLISYTLPSTGCAATLIVTDNPVPGAITGTFSLCQGATTTLGDPLSGGTWTSGTLSVATIGSSTGLLTGVVTGSSSPATSVITYTSAGGCQVTQVITVNPLPGAIAGIASVCPGATTTLTDGGGGTWTSGSPSVATIGSASGLVTGIAPAGGTSIITYSLPVTGCSVTKIVTVNPSPSAISGTLTICPGATTTLTDAGGGTWTSATPTVATIGSSSGTATGILSAGGTSVITYALPVTGCSTTAILTVNPSPGPITGGLSLCEGTTTLLSDAGSGLWSSSNLTTGTIDASTGLLAGLVSGYTTITYTLLGTGCLTTAIATVNVTPLIGPITGGTTVCLGSNLLLSDAATGGTWSSGGISIAIIGTSGTVTGTGAGVVTITYTIVSGASCTNTATTTITVNPLPPAISGPTTVCTGSTISLTEPSSGTWNSNIPGIASVTSPGTTSTLTGVSAGSALITFTASGTGCTTSESITVNTTPGPITGTPTVCIGSTTNLSATPAGGTWSNSTSHVTIGGSTGIVTGLASGTAVITYTLSSGCFTTRIITVNNAPAAISGPAQVCVGSTITLTDAGGGTWLSSNANATVSGAGVVTGVTAGTSVITYTLSNGCFTTTTITINPLPSAITGPSTVCTGQTITLNDVSGTTTWSSSNTSIAAVGSGTGIVSGVAAGTATITFTLPVTGCSVTKPVTVNSVAAITGVTSLCSGTTSLLADANPGGTWLSVNTAVAAIGTTGLVTAIGTGSSTISYTLPSGCFALSTVNVISAPSPISGPSTVCIGSTITLTDAGGGAWTSSNPSVATIGASTGIVTPATTGTTTVTYSLGTGCTVNTVITVNPAPPVITGLSSVCAGSTITLSETGSGTWSSSNANATVGTSGVVSGVTAGTSTITFTTSTGCLATKSVTINAMPTAISGPGTVCTGTIIILTDSLPGGTWGSASGLVSVVSTTGSVTGITSGTAIITYSIPGTGCNVTKTVTITPSPSAITGISSVCVGNTITLSSGGTGTWSSSNSNATVGATTGIVTGVTAGTSTITYTLGTGCFGTRIVTINPLPNPITGTFTVCAGSTTLLGETSTGGTWSSGSPTIATVSSGTVTGVSAGAAVINYTISGTGCAQSATVTVNPLPGTISGTIAICLGGTSTLTDAGGGTWSSSAPAIATIGSSTGLVSSVSAGVTTISYTLPTGCTRTIPVTINPLPAAISGTDSVCTGSTTTLTDAGGGTWTSGTPAVATVGSSTGIVTGIASGISAITYTLSTGCNRSVTVTVHASPAVITGTTNVCAGSTTTLSDGTSGGTWSSSLPAIATIGSTGIVSGLSAGTATISYMGAFGCTATTVVTVNPLPAAISGSSVVCVLANDSLSDAGGGTWTSADLTIATVGSSTGIVTGVSAGTTSITYTLPTGCITSMPVTVNPLPFAGGITGPSVVCADSSITLADTISGGSWSSAITAIAGVGSTGIVSGVSAGADTIIYSVTNSCGTATAIKPITVNPLPVAGTIIGPTNICYGSPVTYTETVTGGSWSSSNTSVATIGSATGTLTSIIPGITNLVYTVTTGCGTVIASKSDTIVALMVTAVIGIDSVCQGDTIHFTDITPGGVWSVTNGNASVDGTGQVVAINAGTDSVLYTITNVCGSISAGKLINIRSSAVCHEGVNNISGSVPGITVYPNPSSGLFTVELPETTTGTIISISDMLGKTIETRSLNNNQPQKVIFDLSHVAAGSYIIKVNAGITTFRDKIVIW